MTPHPYTEYQLVEQPVISLFAALGWHGFGGTLSGQIEINVLQ